MSMQTCYLPDGNKGSSLPCDPSAPVSSCCNDGDYCLSNGVCLNAGGNNMLSIQGCTDPNWGAPCHKYCLNIGGAAGFGSSLVPCWTGTDYNKYCCSSEDVNCCQNSTLTQFSIGVGKPIGPLRLGVSSTSSASSISSTTSTSTSQTTSLSTAALNTSSATATPFPKSDNMGLKIGLGVAIPLMLFIIAALTYFAYQLGSRRRGAAGQNPNARELDGNRIHEKYGTAQKNIDDWPRPPVPSKTGYGTSVQEVSADRYSRIAELGTSGRVAELGEANRF